MPPERRRSTAEMVVRKVGKYEVGRTIGEGTFAKVKFAQNTETGESVAMKVLDRSTIIKHKMVDQVCIFSLSFVLRNGNMFVINLSRELERNRENSPV